MRLYISLKSSLLLATLLVSQGLCAQVAYHNFNSNDGLPSNEVYCVHQDREGYLWFGTDHGVVKYNGYNFKIFTTADGLTDNTILSIKGDDSGNIWFLTLTGGICYYDGQKFAAHPQNDTIIKIFRKRIPTSWEVFAEKEIWMGLVSWGFYDIGINKVHYYESLRYFPYNLSYDSCQFRILTPGNSRYVYLETYGVKGGNLKTNKGLPPFQSFSIARKDWRSTDQNFLLAKVGDKKFLAAVASHLFYLDGDKVLDKISWPANTQVTGIKQTGENQIWVMTNNTGCHALSLNNNKIQVTDSLLGQNFISDILLDFQGNYWLTSPEHGIFMIPNRKVLFLTNSFVTPLSKVPYFISDSLKLYVALSEGFVEAISPNLHYNLFRPEIKYTSPVSCIRASNGEAPLTNVSRTFMRIGAYVYYITKFEEIQKNEWLAGGTGGFLVVRNDKITFDSRDVHFNKRVTAICKISRGVYAIGTYGGMYYFNLNTLGIAEETSLKDTRITAIKKYGDSILGVATRGLGVFIWKGTRLSVISSDKGLSSSLTEDLYFENDSTLWIASFKGLSKVYFHLWHDSLYTKITCYTKEDGLCSNEINVVTGFNNYLWLGTNEGLCYFHPQDLNQDTLNIPFYFGNIYVNGLKKNADSLDLNYFQNNLLIEFNAIYYKAVSGIRYKVRLKGTDNWKFTNQNFIQYFNLPAGNYELQVAADDKFGKYRSEMHSLRFAIHPRFTDTILFKSLIALFLVLIIGTIIYLIFNFQRLKAQNVIKLLQAEFKALNYQINPHFIFNILNSIQYYILKKDTNNAVHLLSSFSTLIRKIVNNSKQQYVSVLDEVECLKEYLDLEKMRLDNKFEYEINIDSKIDIEKKDILPMILQPLVENSIWHGIAPSEKKGKIKIDFKEEDGKTVCIVDDNGVGIHYKNANKIKSNTNLSLAMKNVSERLKIIAGLNDSPWLLKTEDKSDLGAGESGTIVTIIFPTIKNTK